jgi:hypothetical protein
MYGCGPLKLEPYAKDDKYILYRSAVNSPCCPLTPGNILIIECVVALLTAVNGGKVLLKVIILFNVVVPDTFNDDKHVVKLFNVVVPITDNDDNNVDAPATYKLVKLVLLNNVVDVAFKLLIDNVELVDKLFKLLKIVVDVVFKLLIDNLEFVEKLFKLLKMVVDVACRLVIFNTEYVDKLTILL